MGASVSTTAGTSAWGACVMALCFRFLITSLLFFTFSIEILFLSNYFFYRTTFSIELLFLSNYFFYRSFTAACSTNDGHTKKRPSKKKLPLAKGKLPLAKRRVYMFLTTALSKHIFIVSHTAAYVGEMIQQAWMSAFAHLLLMVFAVATVQFWAATPCL